MLDYVPHSSHKFLFWVKSCTWDFQWKLPSCHTEAISAFSFGEVCFLEESYDNMQKFKFSECPSFNIREYAFNFLSSTSLTKVVLLHIFKFQPPCFRVPSELTRVLGIHTERMPAIIKAVWCYIDAHDLQDKQEPEYINNDQVFRTVGWIKFII